MEYQSLIDEHSYEKLYQCKKAYNYIFKDSHFNECAELLSQAGSLKEHNKPIQIKSYRIVINVQ